MTANDYERLIAERAAEVRYHVEHIRAMHQRAETALLVGDLDWGRENMNAYDVAKWERTLEKIKNAVRGAAEPRTLDGLVGGH